MGKFNNYKFWDSASLNKRTYNHYINHLTELAISMFEWKNVPDSIDTRFLELCLYNKGYAVFFKDEVMDYLALNVAINGRWDVYNIPIKRRAYATNGYQRDLDEKNSVIIYNNMLHTNTLEDMNLYARRLYECDRTIDTNIKAQKTPVAIICDENQRLTFENLYQKYDGNEPFIFADKNVDLSNVKTIRTDAPYISDRLMETKFQIWNEALTYLGISNINLVKKERLLTDEISRNMGSTFSSRYNRLLPRQEACEKINKMFGLNMSVDYREDIQIIEDITTFDEN